MSGDGPRVATSVLHGLSNFDPRAIYFVTSHTFQSRPFMAASDEADELVGLVLARAVLRDGVHLFAFVFAAGHFHLLIRASSAVELEKFMKYLRSRIGKKVGQLAGWRGRFFAGRYQATPIVDEEEQLERLLYILQQGVDEGLDSRRWPGLSCLEPLLKSNTVVYQRSRDIGDPLFLMPLPGWAQLARARREEIIEQMLGSRARQRERERAARGAALAQLGPAAV